jgi:hypothetical protein
MLQIFLVSQVLFGKPVSTHRVKPEGMFSGTGYSTYSDTLKILRGRLAPLGVSNPAAKSMGCG